MSVKSKLNKDNVLTFVGLVIMVFGIIVAVIIITRVPTINSGSRTNSYDNSNDYELIEGANDTKFENYLNDADEYLAKNHPIDSALPVENEDPFYYIRLRVDTNEDDSFVASIEISYYDPAGREAAEARLKTGELSYYDLSEYEIKYVELEK